MSHVVKGINDLKSQRPDLLSDWDYVLNTEISPDQISIGGQKKVWWKCNKGHSYLLSAAQKAHGQGCTLCAGKCCVTGINDLATMRPALLAEWDYDANGAIDPHTAYYRSRTKVQWRCQLGHTWNTSIANRVENGTNCPVCAGNVILPGFNDLLSGFPTIAAEWNYEKNKPMLPSEVARYSTKRVWWRCSECSYEWQAQISNRTSRNSGCPNCKRYSHTSFPEQALFYYIQQAYPDAINGYRHCFENRRAELDIYIPGLKLGIEYDGVAWHRNAGSMNRDKKKYEKCVSNGIKLIRIAEFQLTESEQACDIYIYRESHDDVGLQRVIEAVLSLIKAHNKSVNVVQDKEKIMSSYINVQREKSLAFCYPEVAAQWDYEKNGSITPDKVNATTDNNFWWKCDAGHVWRSSVANRTSGKCGCPYCGGKRLEKGENDLQTRYPEIAKWWDNVKNAPLHADDVMPGSMKKYWWFCEKGHSYQASPNCKTANKTGCPVCSNALIVPGINSLMDTHPIHSSFWDYSKNTDVSPEKISAGSIKKYSWICPCGHTWVESASLFSRRKPECLICSGVRLLKGYNDLETTNPDLLKDWDYEKNSQPPSDFLPISTVRVYWRCSDCGHEWNTQIRQRAIVNRSCPVCCYKKKAPNARIQSKINNGGSLADRFPKIADEWDYEGNQGKTPKDVTYGSSMMASWICPKGHKYKAIVADRTGKKKCGCSFCRYERASETMRSKKRD